MPEESKETKAKKLAAARKKLKEYQQRGTASGGTAVSAYNCDSSTNSGHVSSNISERSESDLHLNGSVNDINHTGSSNVSEPEVLALKENTTELEKVNYIPVEQPTGHSELNKIEDNSKLCLHGEDNVSESMHNINAIQVLITEKSLLTVELNKFRALYREKDLEVEELRVQHINANKRVEDLSQRLVEFQKQQEQQRLHNAELQHKLAQARAQQEDHSGHINELHQQLTLRDERLKKLESDFKDKCNELELCQLRVRQLSDENNITKDNRVETLTQTQFMYEQQIRDLQAMVQQLTQDKEQANTQYQTYVQQLNAQVQQLNERNNELTDESIKLQEREKQWVDHIQQLEREIQKNIIRQAEAREHKDKETSNETANEQLHHLQERINELDSERYEFQLKVKSQEDRLNSLHCELKQKDVELQQLKEHLENITLEQPDKTKLLAAMESDKVAASRALTQNVELKKQLDELELRFVQLTNDKADLTNRLDSEQFANREMQTSYEEVKERLRIADERFKFKDEEMIRLSHENEELKKKLDNKKAYNHTEDEIDEPNNCKHDQHDNHEHEHYHDEPQTHKSDCHHHPEHCKENELKYQSEDNYLDHKSVEHHHFDLKHETSSEHKELLKQAACEEATEGNCSNYAKIEKGVYNNTKNKSSVYHEETTMPHIATEEAVEKLQDRFTQLMEQCADLTEEKQRLEHLVMQLQSETETIGEYIALYQTQRRILKQREYEKAAQTAMLQAEREQIRDRLTMLNNLVNTLGRELPENLKVNQQITEVLAQNQTLNVSNQTEETSGRIPFLLNSHDVASHSIQTTTTDFRLPETQQILHKIQDIITEIKENTSKELQTMTDSMDNLNCCSGKFEVV